MCPVRVERNRGVPAANKANATIAAAQVLVLQFFPAMEFFIFIIIPQFASASRLRRDCCALPHFVHLPIRRDGLHLARFLETWPSLSSLFPNVEAHLNESKSNMRVSLWGAHRNAPSKSPKTPSSCAS
jgi:hypothetical protein